MDRWVSASRDNRVLKGLEAKALRKLAITVPGSNMNEVE